MAKSSKRKNRPIVYFIGFTAALAGLLFGLDVGVISGAKEFIKHEFNASVEEIEWVVSSLLVGAVAGTLLSGVFSRHLGRRKTMLLSGLIFVVGSILCAISPSEEVLVAARLILGTAVGMASFTAPLYLSEIAPESVRGALISMYQLMITIGILLAFLSDTFLASYATIDGVTGGHWRWMLGIIAVPAFVMFIGVLFLPESPRWLVLNGKREHALSVLRRLIADEAAVEKELQSIEDSLKVKQNGAKLFRRNPFFRNAIFLGIGLQITQQLTGINVVMYYAPEILKAAGFTTTADQMWGTVIVGLTNVLATFIAIAFVDRLGRKPIMYAGFVVMGVAMISVGTIFSIGVHTAPGMSFAAVTGILVFIAGFAMSAGPIIWVICSEIYPLAGRDLGITCSTTTNWIVNAIVGATFLSLLTSIGPANTFFLYGALNVLFILFFLAYVPETKGVTLEKIESNLLAGKPLRQIGR